MISLQRYSLAPHEGPYASWPLRSLLQIDDRPSVTQVPGYVIEAQYQTPLGDLLITSWDCPFEEANSFVLLDAAQRIQAQAELAVPYGSFLLHAHWPVDAQTLILHYHNQLFYTLRIQPATGWLRRSPRLRLGRVAAWRQDARMCQSYDHLRAERARLAADLDADARRA
jgi:hypothetical protein